MALCSLMVSCMKVDELRPDFIYEMTLSQEAVNFTPEGGTAELTLKSNYQWTAESDVSWCSISPTSGNSGSATLAMISEKNTKIEERVATITVTAGAVVRKIKVVQLNPNGFEIIDYQSPVTVPGLENVVAISVRTNMVVTASSPSDWIVSLQNDLIPGNPPKAGLVRILVKDNTSVSNREAVITINGEGLGQEFAKTLTIIQTPAPEISVTDERVIGTWITSKVTDGVNTDLSLLGTIMIFEDGGNYKETLPSGIENIGYWNVRGDRVGIYYQNDQRRYFYIASVTEEGLSGTMTLTDINSTVLYNTEFSQYSGAAFGLSILEKANTSLTYMILINSDMGIANVTERGICISKNSNPTINDRRYPGNLSGSVIVGQITGLTSAETYNIRAYQSNGTDLVYSENTEVQIPARDLDGNNYTTVRIGTQVWMVENLKTTKFRDGTLIPYFDKTQNAGWESSGSNMTPAFCWIFGEAPDWIYTGDTWNNGSDKVAKSYGAYYNWFAASDNRNLAPEGWHIPSKSEFLDLIAAVGGNTEDFGASLEFKNGLLAHDHYQNLYGWTGWSVNQRQNNGGWNTPGTTVGSHECGWWSSENSDAGYPWMIYSRRGDTGDGGISWTYAAEGYPVRLVRDTESPL